MTTNKEYFKLGFIQGAALSPDGKKAIYALMKTKSVGEENKEELKDVKSLWMLDLESGEQRQFTSEETGGGAPAWSPDGKQIAFISGKNGVPQVFVMPADGGEARALTEVPQGVGGGPLWSPDGSQIAFTAGKKTCGAPPDPTKPYRLTRSIYRYDGMGYIDKIVQDVYVIPAVGGEAKQLTDDDFNYTMQAWSPDGQEILVLSGADPNSFSIRQTLKTVEIIGKVVDLLPGWGEMGAAAWTPNSKTIIFSGTPGDKPIGTKTDLYTMRRRGSEPVNRTAGLEVGIQGGLQPDMPVMLGGKMLVDQSGKNIYLDVQEGGTVHIYEIALRGEESCQQITSGENSTTLLGMTDEMLFYRVSTLCNPIDLYTSDLQGKNEKRLTNINEEVLSEWKMPAVEHLLYPGVDGEQVEGWLLKPAEGEAPYPTVLYIHGGPHSAWGYTFSFDFHMLAGAGYAVLFINHRASKGYGDAFSTAIKGDWGNLDYQDLMYGVDYAIEKGWVDGERMGCCGISGGGNLSTWIVGQTDRFKAAVPENPVTNWFSMYGVSDIGVEFSVEELGGHPHEIPEIYEKCSPITYAHNCTTPTLLVQGEHDYRCPTEQSEQFYTTLKANGCITEMLRLPNSPHVGSIAGPPALRKAQNEALLEWMNRYVLGINS